MQNTLKSIMVPGRKRTNIESYHQSRRPESETPGSYKKKQTFNPKQLIHGSEYSCIFNISFKITLVKSLAQFEYL